MAVSIGFGGSFFKSRELRAVIGDENGEQTRYGGCGGAEAHDRSNCAPTKWRKSTQLSRSRRVLRTAGMGQVRRATSMGTKVGLMRLELPSVNYRAAGRG
jgi:hypothetical protein